MASSYIRKVRIRGEHGEVELTYEDNEGRNPPPVSFSVKHISEMVDEALKAYERLTP